MTCKALPIRSAVSPNERASDAAVVCCHLVWRTAVPKTRTESTWAMQASAPAAYTDIHTQPKRRSLPLFILHTVKRLHVLLLGVRAQEKSCNISIRPATYGKHA